MHEFELLAPGGDVDSIKAAIVAGADAIYCGLDDFNARKRAKNITFDDLNGILKLAHKNNCKAFLTLNIIILDSEIPSLIRLLNKLVNTQIDGVIVQDLGLFYLLKKYFKSLEVHASTQVTTHNEGQILALSQLAVSRVNLSRELSIDEIKHLTRIAHTKHVLTEVFVHGSNCISFSGLCYISSVHGGNSGNRGRCSQPCRDQYVTTSAGKDYPLNLKDNSAFFDLPALSDAKVDSIKIEGRIKKSHYVYTVVSSWRKQIDSFIQNNQHHGDNTDLYKVFNRGFSNSYLAGDINKDMFIDNPRDNSVKHLSELHGYSSKEDVQQVKQTLYDEKTAIITKVKDKTKDLSIEKMPLIISVSGQLNVPLKVSVKTPDDLFVVQSESNLISADKYTIDNSSIEKRFKSLGDAKNYIENMELTNLEPNLFIPFKELTTIKNRIVFLLNGAKDIVAPVAVPVLNKSATLATKPTLSVLISCAKDLDLCDVTSAEVYYQLADCIGSKYAELLAMFMENKKIIPWFPSILIGDDYTAAVKLLEQVKPQLIVTNNMGIAYAAYAAGINWIAGPYLNVTNSFSLRCMQETFNCYGAFISNEINKNQIRQIVRPEGFKLYYSIYHPLLLMTSRQCFFHQTTGCKKERMDDQCLDKCKKSASIINLKSTSFLIDKQKGSHNCMYSSDDFLNPDIVTDLPGVFSSFFIDLRDIKTKNKGKENKAEIIRMFEDLLDAVPDAQPALEKVTYPSTKVQYVKGL